MCRKIFGISSERAQIRTYITGVVFVDIFLRKCTMSAEKSGRILMAKILPDNSGRSIGANPFRIIMEGASVTDGGCTSVSTAVRSRPPPSFAKDRPGWQVRRFHGNKIFLTSLKICDTFYLRMIIKNKA